MEGGLTEEPLCRVGTQEGFLQESEMGLGNAEIPAVALDLERYDHEILG